MSTKRKRSKLSEEQKHRVTLDSSAATRLVYSTFVFKCDRSAAILRMADALGITQTRCDTDQQYQVLTRTDGKRLRELSHDLQLGPDSLSKSQIASQALQACSLTELQAMSVAVDKPSVPVAMSRVSRTAWSSPQPVQRNNQLLAAPVTAPIMHLASGHDPLFVVSK